MEPDVGAVKAELHECVLEISTDPCADVSEADWQLRELRRAVRERVGAHAYPRDVAYVAELPRTAMGKLDRAALRAR
jgi:acyl-coenzyme A synthetase/AMP-(fatty) acid ligase